jgi:DNA-binding NarL/FixJ family response regulator
MMLQETLETSRERMDDPLVGRKIVIVEDEGMTQWQLRRILARAGLVVAGSASDGQTGVDIALRERPDLVLMDINIPVMDGLEAARHILETYSACVVMLTAFDIEEYHAQARKLGACGYIIKPVTADTLLPQLRAAFSAFLQPEAEHDTRR